MEIKLKNDTEVVHRLALDLDDYSLMHSANFATGDAYVKFLDEDEDTSYEGFPLYKYFILIEADNLVNFEATAGINVSYGTSKLTVDSNFEAYLPQTTNSSGNIFSCFYGTFADSIKTPFNYTYNIATGVDTVPANVDEMESKLSGAFRYLFFREAKATTFSAIEMVGCNLTVNIGQYSSTAANVSVKIYRKTLVAGA